MSEDKIYKLSDRIKDTKNRKCDNNDIDYGYNMAIDDWIDEIIELENKLEGLNG